MKWFSNKDELLAVAEQAVAKVQEEIRGSFIELDPNKMYLLIVPSSVDGEELRRELSHYAGKINLITIIADNAKLLELTKHEKTPFS